MPIPRKSWDCGQSFGACHRLQAMPICHCRTARGVDILPRWSSSWAKNLKSLTIKYRCEDARPVIDQIQMDRQEALPSIERLSLERYRFNLNKGGVQVHLNAQSLRSLTLVACTSRHLLLEIPEMRLSQLSSGSQIGKRIHGERSLNVSYYSPPFTKFTTSRSLNGSLGILHATIGVIVKRNASTTPRLRIQNFEHAVLIWGTDQPVPQFKSIPSHVILSIWKLCPHIRSLVLDRTETDITAVSETPSQNWKNPSVTSEQWLT